MKIALCTPLYSDPKRQFAVCLLALQKRALAAGFDIEWFCPTGIVQIARCNAARAALDWGAEWLLWLDGDQTFPPNTLERLLSLGEPIAGCNYLTRNEPHLPTACMAPGQPVETTSELAAQGAIQSVGYLGFGCILTSAEVFRKLSFPWFQAPHEEGRTIGEDVHFCREARKAGYEIWLDHALSMEIGHIAETVVRF